MIGGEQMLPPLSTVRTPRGEIGLKAAEMLIALNDITNGINGINYSDREHFQVHRNSRADELFISKPVIGRASKQATIQLSRRVDAADGRFLGVIVFSISMPT